MPNAIIINNNAIMCLSLSTLLQSEGYTVCGEISDYPAALQFVNDRNIDLALIDCDISDMEAFILARRFQKENPGIKILMMSNQKNIFNVHNAISYGVNGFVFTSDGIDAMRNAFHSIMAGYVFFPMKTQELHNFGNLTDKNSVHNSLSPREVQILRQITSGKKHVRIAEEMKISFKTVSTYKYRIMNKLRLCTTVELLEYARHHGI